MGKAIGNLFKPQIGTIGGGAATNTANNYNNWLNQFLSGGNNNQMQTAIQSMLAGKPGDPNSLSQYFNAGLGTNGGVNNPGQAESVGATFTPAQVGADFSATNFQPSDVAAAQIAATGFQPSQFITDFSAPSATSIFNSPEFINSVLQGVNTNFSPNTVSQISALAPLFQAPQINTVSVGQTGRENFLTDPNTGQMANLGSIVNPAANSEAIRSIMQGQQTRDIADLRERFGNQALSTGAQQAEALYRAESAPRIGLAVDEITRQNNAQALTQRGQDLQNFQGMRNLDANQLATINQLLVQQRGQDVQQNMNTANVNLANNDQAIQTANAQNQFNLANAGNALTASQGNQNAQIAQMNAMLQAMGLSNDAILGANAQRITQSQNQNAFNQGNAQFAAAQALQAAQANQNAAVQAANINQSGMQAQDQSQQFLASLIQDASKTNAAQQLQAALANQNAGIQGAQINQNDNQFLANLLQNAGIQNNQFGQAAAAQQLQAALANQQNQQFNVSNQFQNQKMMNDFAIAMQNIGLGQQNNQLGAQQAIMSMIFGGLNGANQLGTAQRESTVTPGIGSQMLSAASNMFKFG